MTAKTCKDSWEVPPTLTFAATIDMFSVRALRNELQLMHESPRGCGTTHGGRVSSHCEVTSESDEVSVVVKQLPARNCFPLLRRFARISSRANHSPPRCHTRTFPRPKFFSPTTAQASSKPIRLNRTPPSD